ncbi:MAG: hypothetical protein ACTIA6_18215 [Pseudoclavibacter sp.]
MTTPSQWNGQQSQEPHPNSQQQGAAGAAEQGVSGYGTPPSGQPAAYNGYGQAQGQPLGYQQPSGYGYPQSSGIGYEQPADNGYQQPNGYSQARVPEPRQPLTFPTLRDELSFVTNRFGMISLASALGGWILTTLLSFIMSVVARTGSFEIYEVLNPVQTILQILAAAAAIVFGVLALRASAWRNMPGSVGAVLGVVMLVPAIFYFLFGLIPFSY